MKVLLVVKQKKNVDTFMGTIRAMLARGHAVTLAIQEHGDERDSQYRDEIASPQFAVVRCPTHRTDAYAEVAPLLRSLRDCVHYQQPPLRGAIKLQARTVHKLREELRVRDEDETVAEALRELPSPQIQRLEAVFALAEGQLPVDHLHTEFLRAQAPDVLVVSPLVHFGSAQADLVASARTLGIPVGMLLHSWDNLSTKGCLHQWPDWMFVWNERQRREAFALHGFPEDRVVVVGAPRFDGFFELRPQIDRAAFHQPLGLDAARPTLLYVCSSPLISEGEQAFVRKWIAAIRSSAFAVLRPCNIIVRPHPDIGLLDPDQPVEELRFPSLRGLKGFVSRPFDDPHAIVLRTSDRAQQGLYECLSHSAAIVGLNTSAELEAAIVGRPVYTILVGDEEADGQQGTLHFHYLLEAGGGFVRVAAGVSEHLAQLDAELREPPDGAALRRFVGEFLRPRGVDLPVSPLLAEALEQTFAERAPIERGPARESASERAEAAVLVSGASVATQADRRVVPVAIPKYGYDITVHAPAEPPGEHSQRLDKSTVEWLRRSVGIGDVVFDIDAGIGVYSLLAAKHHGAVVVAFEPGYAVFTELCDNLRLNGCDGSVTPLPLALADFEGMGELKYPTGMAGRHKHSIRPAAWHVRRAAGEERHFRQPVYAMRLDEALRRYGLPAPNHLRLGNSESGSGVLAGATQLLASSALKTVFCTLPSEEGESVAARLAPLNWRVARHIPISRGRAQLVLSRDTADAAASVSARS